MNSNQTVIATFNLLVSVLGDRPEKQNPSCLPLGRGRREGLVVTAKSKAKSWNADYWVGSPVLGSRKSGGLFPPETKSNMFVKGPASAS